jgi:hypothetical protein
MPAEVKKKIVHKQPVNQEQSRLRQHNGHSKVRFPEISDRGHGQSLSSCIQRDLELPFIKVVIFRKLHALQG